MKTLLLLISFFVTGTVCAAEETKADFFVSVSGSDSWSGTLAASNSQQSDGPFATLQRARDAVRDLKKKNTSDIVVLVREGTYQLKDTVVFGLEDSGAGDSTVTYAAYPGETPVFSSGWEIKGWQKVSGKLAGLPEEAQEKVWVAKVSDRLRTLYDAEGMLPRAQSERFVPLAGGNATQLHFPKGQLRNWPNVEDVEILVRPTRAWMMNVLPLASIDEQSGFARTAIPATYAMQKYGCWVENVLKALDQPGEWVLNTKEGKLYLWPRGESPVMAPQLIEFIHHVGRIYWHSPGIYVCQSGENRVANNLIHHTNYTALIVSGIVTRFFVHRDDRESVRTIRWHEIGNLPRDPELDDVRRYLHTRNNLIELNEIHHAMQILGDGNGIYIRGAGPGNVIRRS